MPADDKQQAGILAVPATNAGNSKRTARQRRAHPKTPSRPPCGLKELTRTVKRNLADVFHERAEWALDIILADLHTPSRRSTRDAMGIAAVVGKKLLRGYRLISKVPRLGIQRSGGFMEAQALKFLATPSRPDTLDGPPLLLFTGKWCAGWALAVVLVASAARAEDPRPSPAGGADGVLFIAGGGPLPDAVRRHFVDLAGGKSARLVVIPTASVKADQPNLLETPTFFRALDVKSVEVLHTRDRRVADDPEFVKPLSEATGVWLTGGDQSRLAAAYHGTLVEKELQKVLARGGTVGGTSAGAAIMSSLMIAGGTQEAEIGTGFGLLGGVVIDMHFANRDRLHRLLGVLARHPECTGVGIDEETALVVRGDTATVEGNGNVRACFCPHGTLTEANVRVLRNGEKLDLGGLLRAAAASLKEATEIKSADAGKPGTANDHPATTMKP